MSWLKKLEKDIKKDVSHAAKELEKVCNDVYKDSIKVLKTAGEDVAFAYLLPFKKDMKMEIAKRHLSSDNSILGVTGTFIKALISEVKAEHHLDIFGLPPAPILFKVPIDAAATAVAVPPLPPPYRT